ncbi:MAG: S8 family serine peptidase, partial [bacterium]|nr:S8 family serine peptidase [bacterium]
ILVFLVVFAVGLVNILPVQAGHLDPVLEAHLLDDAAVSSRGLVPVIAVLKKRADLASVRGQAAAVCRALRAMARSSQRELLQFINSQPQGAVDRVESLWAVNAVLFKARRDVIESVAKRDDVEVVYYDETLQLPDEPTGPPEVLGNVDVIWSVAKVKAPQVWKELEFTGEGVIVGHIDTGADKDHPDLAGKIVSFRDFTNDGVQGEPYDDQGHGTHTAGTICGGNASGSGIGVAPDARLLVAKVFTGSGGTESSWLLKSMQWMLDPDDNPDTEDAPRVVSNSWGSNSTTNDYYWDIVEAWVAAGIFPCFASGNNGSAGMSSCGTPANFPHSFAVGATDNNNKLAYFSSKGPSTWNGTTFIKPQISSPGDDVTSSLAGGGWGTKSGTSMACPNVAGVVALLLQADPKITVSDMISILEATALDLGEEGNDNYYGRGLIDALAACEFVSLGGTFNGRVFDFAGQPVAAKITVVEANRSVKAADDGTFSFLLKEGTYTVRAAAFGCQPFETAITVTRKEVTYREIRLKEAVKVTVKGSVVDHGGQGLVAQVAVEGDGLPVVQTGTDGSYTLRLPSGVYTLAASCFGYATQTRQISLVENDVRVDFQLEKLPPILLVDDDKDKSFETYFQQALEDNGYSFSYVDGSPAASVLLQYPLVIWFTGNDSSTTLTDDETESLRRYLEGGGSLLISGQDIAYDIKGDSFLAEALKAEYIKDNSDIHVISGIAEPFSGLEFVISGGDGADNQRWPEVIIAAQGGTECFAYSSGEKAAVLSGTETSRIIYLGFGLEGVSTAADRADLMQRACEWLRPDAAATLARLEAALKKSVDLKERKLFADAALERVVTSLERAVARGDVETVQNWTKALESLTDPEASVLKPFIRPLGEWTAIQVRQTAADMQEPLQSLQKATFNDR